MAFLEFDNVSFGFGPISNRYEVLENANLKVQENEFVAIIGFSGSGKSTLISLLAGLEQPDSGEVRLGGKPITAPGPDKGIMFQNYSLLPWLSVATLHRHGLLDRIRIQKASRAFRGHASAFVIGTNLGDEAGSAVAG